MTAKRAPSPRPGVLDIAPYVPGKSALAGHGPVIKLSSNETPFGPSPRAVEAYLAAVCNLSRYPDGSARPLREALASRYGLDPERIVCGAGSDELLNLLAAAYLEPGDEAIYTEHGFLVYRIAILARGATPVVAPETAHTANADAILACVTPKTRLVFLANPNNPTGTWLRSDALQKFLDEVPESVIVVLDEAYFEYVEESAYPDSIAWLARYPNLICARTFSKIYGLAGLRVGYGVSSPAVADLLNRVRQPFNVNSIAQAAALAALDDSAHLDKARRVNADGMRQLVQGFEQLGLGYIPSVGNFVCVEVGETGRVYEQLLRAGVIVRPVANYGMPRHLRVTVGLPEENQRFLDALKMIL